MENKMRKVIGLSKEQLDNGFLIKMAEQIETEIHELKIKSKNKCTFEDIQNIIYLGLKDVQRYFKGEIV